MQHINSPYYLHIITNTINTNHKTLGDTAPPHQSPPHQSRVVFGSLPSSGHSNNTVQTSEDTTITDHNNNQK